MANCLNKFLSTVIEKVGFLSYFLFLVEKTARIRLNNQILELVHHLK